MKMIGSADNQVGKIDELLLEVEQEMRKMGAENAERRKKVKERMGNFQQLQGARLAMQSYWDKREDIEGR
jgi:hypothetical protein